MQNVLHLLQNLPTLCLIGFLSASQLPAQTVIGGTTPHPSAVLDVQSNNKGLLPPRLTTAERNLIAEPATGLLVFNTTLNCIEMNVGAPSLPIWGCLTVANAASVASSMPTLCAGIPMPPITHATSGATGIGVASGLPAGVTATWSSNTITISGTPENLGTFSYSIPLTGGSATGNAEGIITVVGAAVTKFSSGAEVNQPMSEIKRATIGVTGIGSPVGLPAGLTATWATNTITINGTPTETGTFLYHIPLEGVCESTGAAGTITVFPTPNCGAYVAPGEWKIFKCHNLGADESADPFTPSWKLNGDYYQ